MISIGEFYNVIAAVTPLYVAMILAYGSVRWWRILEPSQCSGINRFVAIFAVPLLSFQIIASQNPYDFNIKFVIADALQKFAVLGALAIWGKLSSRGSLDWVITLFMLATLPNTLVVGIPLITAMYGGAASVVTQAVVLQSIVWYTLLLFFYEYRSARLDILQRFPKHSAPVKAEQEHKEMKAAEEGQVFVQLVAQDLPPHSSNSSAFSSSSRSSEMSNAEIYSVRTSNNATPRGSSSFQRRQDSMEECLHNLVSSQSFSQRAIQISKQETTTISSTDEYYGGRELQMFLWSSGTSPTSSPLGATTVAYKSIWSDVKLATTVSRPPTPPAEPAVAEEVQEEYLAAAPSWQQGLCQKLPPPENQPAGQALGTAVMIRMILTLVASKLAKNPNTYASLLGLTWALLSFRYHLQLPKIVDGSIRILSNTGLGMAMFSLGLFMALQPRLLACGPYMTFIGMVVRFAIGPAVMSAACFAVGLHNSELRASILQAALSQGIVPFVFAKQYNVHPEILSTAVIFGMLVSLPILLLYYVLLGL